MKTWSKWIKSKIRKFSKVVSKKKEEKKDKKTNSCLNRFNKAKIENKMKNFVLQSLNLINTSNKF
jgi:hypothetical protein